MIYSYEELLKKKHQGEKLDWQSITPERLEHLFIDEGIINSEIAELYDVSPKTVSSKRSKLGITIYSPKYLYKHYLEFNQDLFSKLNKESLQELSKLEHIDWISKALTHYLFRNGPVENMHANGQLSQQDMKILNKYMVNRLAGLLKLMNEGEWLKIHLMLETLEPYGIQWDSAEYDTKEIDMIYNNRLGIGDK